MNQSTTPRAPIGVIGGSGLYSLLDTPAEKSRETPYGDPSDRLTTGVYGDREVVFLPRHGRGHEHPPHKVPYRANLFALQAQGVRRVIGVGAVGSLRADLPPGSLVVPDQLVDRTTGREQTYFDGPGVAHASFADPYCPTGRRSAVEAAAAAGWPAVDGGTQVVIQGPRFSTRAESVWYSAQGWSIVGMTAHPEVVLARELGLCYIPLCLVTDYDAGVEAGAGVTQEEVFAAFARNVDRLRAVLAALLGSLPDDPGCDCAALRPRPA
ncbi:S-methyl-5'-thioadenosine phosphorylase [Phytomonospora endophytica]|uniref:Purine nucleoside phosphorylase n=1 Tax=Phytomonospora endophytica TaxID=714109 RepID=A0A841G1Z2_9ACTN|nr:S-methyl-5'-thioadenosine phosphorylase [Phytomonospora endophytica]MBB6039667.1 5'-methylthioadenosine phosphorylase [Phytomonospora endophytica]GIG65614.1 purine nucleoside phosphorylase [Phytomonospora endophytica]